MTPCVLLVSTATRWLGTARMPRNLAKAGFDVALLAPKGSLALHSRFVSKVGLLSETASAMEMLHALIGMVDKVAPRLLIPCDEMAVRLLFAFMLEPPRGLDAYTKTRLTGLIETSLGDSRHYWTSIDKTLLPAAAKASGVRMPECAVVGEPDGALAFADAHGYPVVLKRRYGFAGQGVAIVSSGNELGAAMRELQKPDQLDLGGHESPRLLVQSFIAGPHISQALVAVGGESLAGFAWERFVSTRPVAGQTAVLRFVESPATRSAAEKLCRALGMTGFLNMQFVIDEKTGAEHLLEVNRRIVTHTHLGERFGADLGEALFDRLTGRLRAPVPRFAGRQEPVAIFPREWLNDPASRHLRDYPVDAPWDDPGLFAALLRMRDEGAEAGVSDER